MVMLSIHVLLYPAFIAVSFAYNLGTRNLYDYETSVIISEDCNGNGNGNSTGHRLKSKIEITTIWQDPQNADQKLLKLKVSEPQLLVSKKTGFEKHTSGLEKARTSDSLFLLKNGRAEKFWDNPSEHFVLRNLKRSVASLLQVKRKDGEEKLEDVSGECTVFYKVEGNTVRRSKRKCRHPAQDSVSSQPSGVRSSSVLQAAGIDCEMKDGTSDLISRCLVTEHVKTHSNLWKKASACIHSTSAFVWKSTKESKEVFKNVDYSKVVEEVSRKGKLVEDKLFAVIKSEKEHVATNIEEYTSGFRDSLKATNLAKLKSASAFFKLLPTFRSANKADILKVLENKKFEPILPQILDLVAASSSENSVKAALTFFGKTKNYDENLERFLVSLSALPRTESFTLKDIKAFLKKGNPHEKIEATLIATLGALVRTYARNDKADSQVIEDVLDYLQASLKKCKNDECISFHLRGFGNAAQPKSMPVLLEYALKGGKLSLEAMLAVKNMPSIQLPEETQLQLLRVFNEVGSRQDRSSRAIAAEILLRRNPTDDVLRILVGSLSDQSDVEFSTFVASKILLLTEEDERLKSRLMKILTDKEVAHYYSLSQRGKSSLFKRQLLSTDGLNVTYGIDLELLDGGMLKRSSFDVELETENDVSNLLSVRMFAEGLGSFAGESSEEEGNPTAGMELTLLGSSLRPYTFFGSTSELMGHVWSGTASSPTPALQGVFSLSDDNQLVVLHNGMAVRLELRAVLSTDLSASIQISVWYRNSQSQVKNAAALLVKGAAIVDTDFTITRGEYLFYGQSSIDFSSDLEFAQTPFKMCFQMEQPAVTFKHDFQRSVEVTETKFLSKKTKKRKRFIPGRSYALHQNNNELCRIMKGSDDY